MSLLRRKRKHRIFRTARFFRWFRSNTHAVCLQGNRIHLFNSGAELFTAMLKAFAGANSHICAEFYIIRNDRTGQTFAESLMAAASRGVRVQLIYDYIGCFDTPGSFFRRLESSGVQCLPFNPLRFGRRLTWLDRRDHRKIAVIDGVTAFLGGINVGDEYAGHGEDLGRWRDVGMRIDGPAAGELQQLFRQTWYDETKENEPDQWEAAPPCEWTGADSVMIVTGSPHHNRSRIRSAFMLAIAGASERVAILTPYFVPGPRFIRSLLRAARRGVKVQLVLPACNDVPIVRLVSRSYYAPLLKAGVEIYERLGTVLHAKVMLVDGCWAVVGSANLDNRSFHRNYEINVIVDSHEFGTQLEHAIAEDIRRSTPIQLHEHERRSLLVRLMERVCAPASWFL